MVKEIAGKLSYKTKLIIVLSVFVSIPYLLLSIGYLYNLKQNIGKDYAEGQNLIVKTGLTHMQSTMEKLYEKMAFITNYNTLNQILIRDSKMSILETLNLSNETNQVFKALFPATESSTIVIYTNNLNIYDTDFIRKVPDDLKEYFDALPNDVVVQEIKTINGKESLCINKRYFLFNNYYNVISITIPFSELGKSFGDLDSESDFVLYRDLKGKYALVAKQKDKNIMPLIDKYIQDGWCEDYQVTEHKLSCLDGTVITFFDNTEQSMKIKEYYLRAGFLLLLLLCVIILLIHFISNRLTRKLTNVIADIKLEESVGRSNKGEVSKDEFDIIRDKYHELIKKTKEENEKILKLEIEMLQQKISPHFLYNNLSAIKWNLADDSIGEIIDVLISYYRNAFHKPALVTSLKNELEGLDKYIKLLMFSYNKVFRYVTDVGDRFMQAQIPSNILQPLIENAFIHGVNCLGNGLGTICVSAYVENEAFYIEITDNACTMSADDINKIIDEGEDLESACAIKAINKRIQLYYGKKYGLKYISRRNELAAVLMLPKENLEEGCLNEANCC